MPDSPTPPPSGSAATRADRQRPSLSARAQERSVGKQRAFLRAFAELGAIQAACRASRIGRRTIYDWLGRDEKFAREFELARDAAADLLEAEARRRGVEGVPEGVFFGGKIVGYVTRFSDCCLLSLLAAHRPERFGRRRAGKPDSPPLAVVHVSYDKT